MAFEFKLPDIGEGLTEGEVVKWLVKEGDAVTSEQPMVEVMTDKATVEITSPRTGRIAKILAAEGQKVPVGSVMVVIEEGAGGAGGAAPAAAPAPKAAATPAAKAPAAPAPSAAPAAPAPARAAPAPAHAAPAPAPVPVAATAVAARARTLAAPATRKRARELGLDLNAIPATGPNGRLTRTDLESYASNGGRGAAAHAPAAAPAAPGAPSAARPAAPPARVPVAPLQTLAEDQHVPLRGLRGKIAEQMLRSKQHSPHFTYADECDMTEVVRLREAGKASAEERGVKLTFLPFIMKALVSCFRRFPTVNSLVDDTKNEYVVKRDIHIGLATDTEDGLTVPVVKHVDRRSILDLAAEVQRLTEAARAKKIAVEDLKGGTFTITSAGSIGGILATPILNYPEVGILGVYKISDRPVVRDGQIVIRKMANLSITLDHRIVDGATAARFMNELIRLLQTPGLMLLEGA
jgi:pyruvate dehydrogenase E2 component (dihydrolipoamide acetyltransferase)